MDQPLTSRRYRDSVQSPPAILTSQAQPPEGINAPLTVQGAHHHASLEAHIRHVTVQFQNGLRRADGSAGFFTGTGFCLSTDGHDSLILTNRHIAESVHNSLGHVWRGHQNANFSIVAISKTHDLALVKTGLRFKEVGVISERNSLQPGEKIATFGFPTDAGAVGRLEYGTYIGRDRSSWVYPNEYYDSNGTKVTVEYAILGLDITSIHTPGGTSGSPIFDLSGEVVSVVFGYDPKTLQSNSITARNIRRFLRSRGVINAAYGETNGVDICDGETVTMPQPISYTTEGGRNVLVQEVKPRPRRSYPEEADVPVADASDSGLSDSFLDFILGRARSPPPPPGPPPNRPLPLPPITVPAQRIRQASIRPHRRSRSPLFATHPMGSAIPHRQREDSSSGRTSYSRSSLLSSKGKASPLQNRVTKQSYRKSPVDSHKLSPDTYRSSSSGQSRVSIDTLDFFNHLTHPSPYSSPRKGAAIGASLPLNTAIPEPWVSDYDNELAPQVRACGPHGAVTSRTAPRQTLRTNRTSGRTRASNAAESSIITLADSNLPPRRKTAMRDRRTDATVAQAGNSERQSTKSGITSESHRSPGPMQRLLRQKRDFNLRSRVDKGKRFSGTSSKSPR
jgi:hypothetical protein